MSRRYKRIAMTPEFFVEMIRDGDHAYSIIKDGVPADAKIVRCGYDNLSNQIYVFIEHESFDQVTEGEIVPELYPLFHNGRISTVRIISSDEVRHE